MLAGASSACFYPEQTEKALKDVISAGFDRAEIFFNALSELDTPFLNELLKIKDENKIKITSVHPFSSFLESSCIFGDYERRYKDFIGIYEKTCYAAAVLGAPYVVIHGAVAQPKIPIPDERYFSRFQELINIGKREGVVVCQENVNRFKSQSPDFCRKMKNALGNDFKMVFDIKQTVRAGVDTFSFLEEFKDDIVHVHLSDNSVHGDCQPPGEGTFDFQRVYDILGDRVTYIIEIYSSSYDVKSELIKSRKFLSSIH